MKPLWNAAGSISMAALAGKLLVTAGIGGMGGAQPLAATMAGAVFIGADIDPTRIQKRLDTRYIDRMTYSCRKPSNGRRHRPKEQRYLSGW